MIRFKTRLRKPNLELEYTVDRIAEICCGHENAQHRFRNDNGAYVLSSSNDWFLRPDREQEGQEGVTVTKDEAFDDDFRYWELDYRYTTEERQKALEGLALFLEYTLGDI